MVYEVQNILYNITNSQRKKYIKKVKKYKKKVNEYRYHDMYTLLASKDVKQNDR